MNKKLLAIAVAGALATPLSFAAEEAAPAPASPLSFNVGVTTNYLFRGVSQTHGQPALSAGIDYAHDSGFYVGAWGSSISWVSDAGLATNAGLELDTYFGYKGAAGAAAYDVGFLRYNYPGQYANPIPAPYTKPDTNEVYGAVTYSIVTAKLSYSLGSLFSVPNAKGSTYLDLSASYPVGDSGYTLTAHYGKQAYKGTTADSLKAGGADPSYADYKLGVTKDFSGYVVGVAYSNTNAAKGAGTYYYIQNKNLGKARVVLSLSRTF